MGQEIQPDIFAGAKMGAPRPQGEGQDGPSQSAKRTVVHTVTLDTGEIIMTINEFRAQKSVLVRYPG